LIGGLRGRAVASGLVWSALDLCSFSLPYGLGVFFFCIAMIRTLQRAC
jgi:hypothetical protein